MTIMDWIMQQNYNVLWFHNIGTLGKIRPISISCEHISMTLGNENAFFSGKTKVAEMAL